MATGVEARFEALVLAAGVGLRFGGAKLLAPWRDGVLLDGALTAAFAAPARTVTVVTGGHAEGVSAAASAFAARAGQAGRLRLVHAEDHEQGLSASLKAGIAALPADAAGAFVFLGDMPRIPIGLSARLAEAMGDEVLAVAPLVGQQRGHPVLLSAALFPKIAALAGDAGAGALLKTLGSGLAVVSTDDRGCLIDVDRPEDLAGA